MLDKVKMSLRVMGDIFDEEIQSLIDAGITDLEDAGVNFDKDNQKHVLAVTLFVKENFGINNTQHYTRYAKAYNALKISLAIVNPQEGE